MSKKIFEVSMLIKMIISALIIFQTFLSFAYFDSFFDRYPIKKKNKNDANEAPVPNKIF